MIEAYNESKEIKKDNEILIQKKEEIEIDDRKRTIIFIVLVLIASFSSCDGGIIPQQNSNIKYDFKDDGEQAVGLFGSIDFIGRVVGALIFTIIMGKMNRKILIISTLIFKALTLFAPFFSRDVVINDIARCLSGLSQVFYPTYFPVWCDQYGKKDKRAIWVTIVQVGNPIGIIIGYGLGMFCDNIILNERSGWRIAFPFEGIILFVFAIIIIFFDSIYFSEKFVLTDDSKGKIEENNQEVTLFENFGNILCNKIFLFSSLCNSVAFFGIGVVQFYGNKYMDEVLGIGESSRFVIFAVLCLLGPTTGMVFGGIICSKLGGYVKRVSMGFVILSMTLASVVSMLIACHRITVLFIITAWTYLFGIGNVIPPLSGIIISCLDNNLRGDGFSLCNFLNNLLGNFPSSYAYSLLADLFHNKYSENNEYLRYAWMVTMTYNFVGLILVFIAGIFRFGIKGDLSEKEKKDDGPKKLDDLKTDTGNTKGYE